MLLNAMDWQFFQPVFDWLANHSFLAEIFVFLIAFAESLFIVGLILPGTVLMFGVGTLVGAGVLDLWHTMLIAFLGAVAGDGLSFYIGKFYYHRIVKVWPFNKHPDFIDKGKAFFEKHGGKSILIGRFVGPVRPVIPAVAGMMGMSQSYFFAVNIISALGWAPFYLIPGFVFGSSIQLAAEVGSRLVILFIIAIVAILLLSWLIKFVYLSLLPLFQKQFVKWLDQA
ncbi:MAG: DedA family protein, partial [Gammaproteobacteria bacterium]|nr:DedA family protein [Gammaproteobacteria bacterium]